MDIGVISIQNGKIGAVNKICEKILGFKVRELTGKTYRVFFQKILTKEHRLEDIFNNGKKENCSEVNLIIKNGEIIPAIITFVPLEPVSIIIIQDLRERKRMEKYLHRMDRMKIIGELAAGVVHEIRNPLTNISTNIQYIKENIDSQDKYYEEIQDIASDIKDIEETVRKILDFARPKKPYIIKTDIHQLIDESLRFTRMKLRRNGIEIVKKYGSEIPDIEVDPTQIKQVFFNLIYNACEAMKDGGKLTILTRIWKKDYVEIDFADTGKGISKKNINKIFNPFFTTHHKGTGLGLLISRKIVEEHKGSIEVKSKVGKGANFIIKIPISKRGKYGL